MKYDGNHGEMEKEFKNELMKLIEHLLSPKNLVIKKINQKNLTSSEYFEYVKRYLTTFQSEELPKAETIYESTIKQQLSIVINSCLKDYKDESDKKQHLINTIDHIQVFHEMFKSYAILKYHDSNKMGNNEHHVEFKDILMKQIDNEYKGWSKQLNKRITATMQENQKKTEEKDTELSRIKHEVISNKKLIKELKDNLEISKGKLDVMTNEKNMLNDELTANRIKIEELKAETEILVNEKDKLNTINKVNSEELEQLKERLNSIINLKNKNETKIKFLECQSQQSEEREKELHEKIDDLKAKNVQKINELRNQLKSESDKITKLEDELKSEKERHQKNVRLAEVELQQKVSELSEVSEELDLKEIEIINLKKIQLQNFEKPEELQRIISIKQINESCHLL